MASSSSLPTSVDALRSSRVARGNSRGCWIFWHRLVLGAFDSPASGLPATRNSGCRRAASAESREGAPENASAYGLGLVLSGGRGGAGHQDAGAAPWPQRPWRHSARSHGRPGGIRRRLHHGPQHLCRSPSVSHGRARNLGGRAKGMGRRTTDRRAPGTGTAAPGSIGLLGLERTLPLARAELPDRRSRRLRETIEHQLPGMFHQLDE